MRFVVRLCMCKYETLTRMIFLNLYGYVDVSIPAKKNTKKDVMEIKQKSLAEQ